MSDTGVAWDRASRELVHPRRGSPVILPKADTGKAWARVRKAYAGKTKAAVTKGRKSATKEDRALTDAAIASLAKKSPPENPDPVLEGVRAQLLGMEAHFVNMDKALLDAHDALIHLWCVAYGVPFAVGAMIETFRTARVDWGSSIHVARDPKCFGTYGNINHYRAWEDPVDVTPWHVLRAHVAACDDATYAKARAVAKPVHEAGHDLMFRCALSFVFPDEEAWARKTLDKSTYEVDGVPSIYHCAHALVSCFRDRPTIERFFDTGSYHPEFAYDVLDVLGAKAFPLLKRFYEDTRRRSKNAQKKAFAPLMLVDTEPARAWLLKHGQDPVVGPMLRR